MNTKSLIIAAVIIVVLAAGGYVIMKPKATTPASADNAQAQTNPQVDPNNVQAQDITVGTGALATPGSKVSVLYAGKLQDGTIFDSSAAHNNQPLTFVLGAQGLIPGFQIGINGMKEGGERIMIVPASLAYGAQDIKDPSGKVIIPANSPLIFDVKLVKVEAGPATDATSATTTTKKK